MGVGIAVGAAVVVLHAVVGPFLMPALRARSAPFVYVCTAPDAMSPSTHRSITLALARSCSPAGLKLQTKVIDACRQYSSLAKTPGTAALEQRTHRLIDLGSGNGCLVVAAAQALPVRGVGVELNPWLVWWSRWQAFRAGVSKYCSFQVRDLWSTDLSQYDTIVVCGVPDMMPPLADKLRHEMKPDAILIAGRFKMESWTPTHTLLDSSSDAVDGVWVYHKPPT